MKHLSIGELVVRYLKKLGTFPYPGRWPDIFDPAQGVQYLTLVQHSQIGFKVHSIVVNVEDQPRVERALRSADTVY